jgi:hypothetical protein
MGGFGFGCTYNSQAEAFASACVYLALASLNRSLFANKVRNH